MKRVGLIFGALVATVWWFVLRGGPRRELPEGVAPVTAEGAIDRARKMAAVDQVGHADLVGTWAPTTATDVEVLVEGNTFYPRMLEDIASASGSIHVMQYGFQPGVVGDPFARAFAAKAREGVKVRLILDALGSHAFTSSKRMLADLAEAGVEVMLHDFIPPDRHGPIGQRRAMPHAWQAGRVEHRKLVLVDGRVAYIGGAGIEDHFANGKFHDVYIRVTGPITRQLQALFVTSFRYHGGTFEADDPSLQDDASTLEPGSHNVTLHMNWPRGWLPLTDAATELIESATRRLEITNPYIGDPGLIHAIAAAARRGARVRLLVSDDAHGGIAYAAFQHHYDELLDAGVEIFEYPALVHAKVIVSDDRALVGTLNLDAWAMFRNPEHGLLFDDKTIADRVSSTLIETGIAASIRGEPTRSPLLRARNRVLAKASYLF